MSTIEVSWCVTHSDSQGALGCRRRSRIDCERATQLVRSCQPREPASSAICTLNVVRVMPSNRVVWSPSLFRWAGSKRRLLPHLLDGVPEYSGRYIEPFAGSACLFFALNPPTAVLGDINDELLLAFGTIRRHPRLVVREARSFNTDKRSYYRIRSIDPTDLPAIGRAARFLYLNRYCFNGVYRTNRLGQFNVPRGVRTGKIPSDKLVYRCSIALRSAELRSGDFSICLSDIRKDDFVYLDPPYASLHRPCYGEYGYGSFGAGDINRLAQSLIDIDRAGATFLLSYSANASALNGLLRRWFVRRIVVRRHVAGFARHRAAITEILASNRPLKGH